jgi:uncharacterized protein (TIGR02996 family)
MAPRAAAGAEDAFLRDILEFSGDDTPRLVFADWLEERGDPRGTFIRLQCQRANMTPHDPGFKELLAQESALFKQYETEWSRPIRRLVDEVEYRRGFIEHVGASTSKFLKNANLLFRRAPVRSVQLTLLQGLMRPLADCPQLARLQALDLSRNGAALGSRTLQLLVQSPQVRELRRLRLFDCTLGPASAEVLAGATQLTNLTSLLLGRNSLGEEGAGILASASSLASLRELILYDNGLASAGAIALSASPHFRLTHLDLGMNQIGNEGLNEGIAASVACVDLRRLDLRDNMITNAGIEALLRSPYLKNIEHLDLHGNRISDRGLQALAAATTLPNLTYLNVQANEYGPAAAQAFASSANYPRMRQLLLGRQGEGR